MEPTTTRLRAAAGLREGLTVEDVAMFLRMTKATDTPEQRRKALDVILAGMLDRPSTGRARGVIGSARA
ncbi:hypothetical protein [Dactylosporangium darangshiense]|uniref:hypothetical protein n=1 Tax=Dactylosporangium darangshiense TaxID=579108 RepID=UPI003625A9E2